MTSIEASVAERFENLSKQTLYHHLEKPDRDTVRALALRYRLTFQELKHMAEVARDLEMWGGESLASIWERLERECPPSLEGPSRKKKMLELLTVALKHLRGQPKSYPAEPPHRKVCRKIKVEVAKTPRKIFGNCPVSSPKTVCCQLKTIDVVTSCAFDCSYCTIQTFYGQKVLIDADLRTKLKSIKLKSGRFYHIGTGQSSDSMMWGNPHGMLDALCGFAEDHPNVLLELKTKSANVDYFLDHTVPPNVVCSWSLNTETIIRHEEHGTAGLRERLEAARKVADRGVKVAFHFHPIVYYSEWEEDYQALAREVLARFNPSEVLFISLGSVTLIKPVIRKIRERGGFSKILQMDMVRDPHGKLTYPSDVKLKLFKTVYGIFAPWHGRVYMYLCMEHADYWDKLFGWHYSSNDEFEEDFGKKVMPKLRSRN